MCKFRPMYRATTRPFFATLFVMAAASSSAFADPAESVSHFNSQMQKVLNSHCVSCHREDKQKGQVRLDNFSGLRTDEQNDLLDRVEEQIFRGEMPPAGKEPIPAGERAAFLTALKNRSATCSVENPALQLEKANRAAASGTLTWYEQTQ